MKENIFWISNSYTPLIKGINVLKKSDKVIVSGIFNYLKLLLLLTPKILKKSYLHFWGGDYASFSEIDSVFQIIKYNIGFYFVRNCFAVINLNKFERESFEDIFKIKKLHFVGRFPSSIDTNKKLLEIKKNIPTQSNRIIVGNSATKTNNHIEIFELLKNKVNANVEIFCPLAYGDFEYRKEVVKAGESIFQNNFYPILDLIPQQEYFKFLNTCQVGIFGMQRQQAMGNIHVLLKLGKKVYLDEKSVVKNNLDSLGIKTYKISDLNNEEIDEILSVDSEEMNKNSERLFDILSYENTVTEWINILGN